MTHTFVKKSPMPVSADVLFDWHERKGAFERLNPSFDPVILEERKGGLEVGASTTVLVKVGPVRQRWVAKHTAYEPKRLFRDEQVEGPFAKWVHTHRFEPQPDGTSVMHDEVDYALPLGPVGDTFGNGTASSTLERTFGYRHALLHADLVRHAQYASRPRLTVAITGASGMVGSALRGFLDTGGHTVRAVGRSGSLPDVSSLDGADVVVNLAGAGVADERWSTARKALLVDSRVAYTKALIKGLQNASQRPKVLIQASAIGIYGDRGDELLTETSPVGERGDSKAAFLARLCQDWEAEALAAANLGVRVVLVRIGLVQSARGGALNKLLTPFLAGVGGPVGSGTQWQSWISGEDLLGVIHHAMWNDSLQGPVNAVAPNPLTSAEYGQVLGKVLHRPSFVPAPAFALRALFGELADGGLLASQRVLPTRLQASGFSFLHPTLEQAFRFTLGRAA